MKRLVFCFDGTWNRIVGGYPTNVPRIAHAVRAVSTDDRGHRVPQLVYYDQGVGTDERGRWTGALVNKLSGAFGFGLNQNIVEAYTCLILNYEPGDEIYVFGFSRGAFTARSFIGLIRNCAILEKRQFFSIGDAIARYRDKSEKGHPNSDDSRHFRLQKAPRLLLSGDRDWRRKTKFEGPDNAVDLHVRYIGVWDTVGALGVPNIFGFSKLFNRKYAFHDTELSSFVEFARHAVAADERRKTFEPALWSNLRKLNEENGERYRQRIYPGTHSALGGGGPKTGISDAALEWIFRGAQEAGLDFDTAPGSPLYNLLPDHREQLFNAENKKRWQLKDRLLGAGLADRCFDDAGPDDLDDLIYRRWHHERVDELFDGEYRPPSLRPLWEHIAANPPTTDVDLSDELFTGIRASDRDLRMPKKVERYTIQPADDWAKIARRFHGDERYWKAIFLYNFSQCILYDPKELHATREIMIPIYD
ncbi:MAG: DUF2235 domain-containing protein [Parasphingopyxis sp.]